MIDFPENEERCQIHPSRLPEWDGTCHVCPSCVLDHPVEGE